MTIQKVLNEFLAEQRERLAPRRFAQYEQTIQLLQHSLNSYAYQGLSAADQKRLNAGEREFCEVFGPEHILPNTGEFLGYFMIRQVIAGKELVRAAGTVIKRLAGWLEKKGYVDADKAAAAKRRGAKAARDLPLADELGTLMNAFAEQQPRVRPDQVIEGHFQIQGVRPDALQLEDYTSGEEIGWVPVSPEISKRAKPGWTFSGAIARLRGKWRLLEAWNVYPD